MRAPLLFMLFILLCTLCWSLSTKGNGNTSTKRTTKDGKAKPTTTKKPTTEKRTTPPPVDCKLPRCYLLSNNSCFTPSRSQNFNGIFATCQGNSETRYILTHFMLNSYLDSQNKFNPSSPEVVEKLKDQEAILYCILNNLGIIQGDKQLIEGAALISINNTMQATFWAEKLAKALSEYCKYLKFTINTYLTVFVQCTIYVAIMKTLEDVIKGKKGLGLTSWANDAFCNTTMTTMFNCNKKSPFYSMFKEPNDSESDESSVD